MGAICLPEDSLVQEDRPALVTSWERLSSSSGLRSEVVREVRELREVREVRARTLSRPQCRRRYGGRYRISRSVICAQTEGEEFCRGDSWSSLSTEDQQGHHFLIGFTSWAQTCSKPGYPGLYTFTSIAAIRDWLQGTMMVTQGNVSTNLPTLLNLLSFTKLLYLSSLS